MKLKEIIVKKHHIACDCGSDRTSTQSITASVSRNNILYEISFRCLDCNNKWLYHSNDLKKFKLIFKTPIF